jgi:hypothetical protein
LRVRIIAVIPVILLMGATLAIALHCEWLHPITISRPSPPPSPELKAAVTPDPLPQRLDYQIDTTRGNGLIAIVNQERHAWNDVHVETADHDESFQCPALPTIGSGHTLMIQTVLCRSSDGHVPMHVCVVRVRAQEGGITTGLEPCVSVQ